MFRDTIRAAARLRGSKGDARNSFWQNVVLVIIGAAISFVSSLTTNYYNSKNESKKVALEQKLLFERDVVNCLSQNVATARHSVELDPYLYFDQTMSGSVKLKPASDTIWPYYEKMKADWGIRTTAIELLMNSYVDTSMCNRFEDLDFKLHWVLTNTFWNLRDALNVHDNSDPLNNRTFNQKQTDLYYECDSTRNMYEAFMRDFHAEILQ
jgi:hypothetical protein